MENNNNAKKATPNPMEDWLERELRALEERKARGEGNIPFESEEEKRKREHREMVVKQHEEEYMKRMEERRAEREEEAERAEHDEYLRRIMDEEKRRRLQSSGQFLEVLKRLGCHEMGTSDPYIFGREEEIKLLEKTLIQLKKPNAILVGGAGTGKTAIVEKLAYNIRNNQCVDILKGHIVVELSTNQLMSDTSLRGQLEKKIEDLLKALKGQKVILFIDEFHTAMSAGVSHDQPTGGLADSLKPYLARGEIKVIGATTDDEFQYIMRDSAFERRFRATHVVEPTLEQTETILKNSCKPYFDHYNINVPEKYFKPIVLASQAIKGFNPDKSLTILELAMSNAKYENRKEISASDIKYGVENY